MFIKVIMSFHFQDIKLLSYNFLYLFFIEIRKDLVGKGNGSIFVNLKTDILKEYQISVSTPEVLSRFSKVIDPIFENTTGFNFSPTEKLDLIAFLKTLTDNTYLANPLYQK
jgi:hypothetical protein